MKLSILVLLLLAPLRSEAITFVYYFGGHRASNQQMQDWESKATSAGLAGKGNVLIKAYSYPTDASFGWSSVVNSAQGKKKYQEAAKELAESLNENVADRVIIAGHSSGCALALMLAKAVTEKVAKQQLDKVELVLLDGFGPGNVQGIQDKMKTTCWNAEGMGGRRSLNFGATSGCKNKRTYPAGDQCRTPMCLHFSLVNKGAPANLGGDYPSRGYNDLKPNLIWAMDDGNSPSSNQHKSNAGGRRR